jgi:hypothetical protein
MTYSINELETEIFVHPKERKGFQRTDIKQIPETEIGLAKELLFTAVEEGKQRCAEPLKWLLEDQYTSLLSERRNRHPETKEAYFLLTFELFKALGTDIYIEEMKASLLLADDNWEYKSSDLGCALKNSIPEIEAYTAYCFEILKTSTNKSLIKSALKGILNSKKNRGEVSLSENESRILEELTSGKLSDKNIAIRKVTKIIAAN